MIVPFQYALRSLRKSPAFALTVILTLGIGIGLNAAIFTVVDSVLLRPLGYHDADRIVAVKTRFNDEGRSIPRLGGDDYVDLAREVKGLEATAQYQYDQDGFTIAGTTVYSIIATVSPGFTDVMGVQPLAGRVFRAVDRDGTDVLLSAAFAREHFASVSAALGQTVSYGGKIYTVAGVLPDGFSFPAKAQAWFEMPIAPGNRTSYNNRVIAKRRAGVSAEQLDGELAAFSAALARTYPEDRKKSIEEVPLKDFLVTKIRPTLHLMMGSVLVVLLIVCANITHLQLVRTTRMMRAVSIRTALGASRAALATGALAETILLATAGCALALLLAIPALHLLSLIAPQDVPRLAEIHLNFHVFFFSLLVSLLLMALSALLPVWRSWHVDPASALRSDTTRGTESRASLRLRSGFIVAEVALTLTLSVAAVLLTRQLIDQSRQELGFAPERLVTLDSHAVVPASAGDAGNVFAVDTHAVTPASAEAQAATAAHQDAVRQENLNRLQSSLDTAAAVPGVESAAAISGAPMGFGSSNASYAIRGKQVFNTVDRLPVADIKPITPGFFATMGVPLLRGRNLSSEDRNGASTVLVINRELARQEFGDEDPVGKQIMCGYDEKAAWWTIVGVVGDMRSDAPGLPPSPTFYVPVAQHRERATDMQIIVRTKADPALIGAAVSAALQKSHPEIAVKATTMVANIGDVQRTGHFRTILFASFAGISILLAALGMYGVTAYTVAQRRFEFGLRVALGANRTQLLSLVLRGALTVALLGVAMGTALSLGLQRVLGSVIGKLPAFDVTAYALASFGVLGIALLATLIPARRAAGADPMTVLRSE